MIRFLLRHIDRVVIVFGLLALMVLAMRTLHNVALMAAEVTLQQELRRDYGDFIVLFTLNAGNNKPVFFNRQGDALVEYSAWSSFVTVDGISLDLWSHAFNAHVDKETGRMYLTMSSSRGAPQRGGPDPKRYQIEQQVDISGKTARVRYYFIPNQPVDTVRFVLGHYGWYFERLRMVEDVVMFDRSNLLRERHEQSDVPSRYTPVTVRPGPGGKIEVLRNQFGPYAFNVTYSLQLPTPYEKTLIAEEELRI
ncbi:MAG: hypothetical protein ACRDGM_12050 [bacterium]